MLFTPSTTAELPITYAAVRAHLKLDHDLERDYLLDLIRGVRDHVEKALGLLVVRRSATATFSKGEEADKYPLLGGPLGSITSVTADGVPLAPADYEVRYPGNTPHLVLLSPAKLPLVVTYTVGLPEVPFDLRAAMLRHLTLLYEKRSATGEVGDVVPFSVQAIYRSHDRSPLIG